jgi:hypothetical protein
MAAHGEVEHDLFLMAFAPNCGSPNVASTHAINAGTWVRHSGSCSGCSIK